MCIFAKTDAKILDCESLYNMVILRRIGITENYGRQTMKKRITTIIIVVSSAIVLSLGIFGYINLLDTSGLIFIGEDERIVYFSSSFKQMAVVSDKGNCYLRGQSLTEEQNFGFDKIRQYNNNDLWNMDKYAELYDKGDAVSIDINSYGGTIVTKTNDVYIFVNGDESFRTPAHFCSGYSRALLGGGKRVYLLSENGRLGYVTLDKPDDFTLIGENVSSFNVVERNSPDSVFVLTNEHRLYILEPDEKIENNVKYIEKTVDFDILLYGINTCILSIVDEKQDAYLFMHDSGLTYDNFADKDLFQKTGENISSVTSYGEGIAMINNNGDLALYGSDAAGLPENQFSGEVVFTDVKAVFGGTSALEIIMANGETAFYGTTPSEASERISK